MPKPRFCGGRAVMSRPSSRTLAAVGRLVACRNPQRRRLSRARCTDQREQLAGGNLERYFIDRYMLTKAARDPLERERSLAHCLRLLLFRMLESQYFIHAFRLSAITLRSTGIGLISRFASWIHCGRSACVNVGPRRNPRGTSRPQPSSPQASSRTRSRALPRQVSSFPSRQRYHRPAAACRSTE